MAPVFLQKENNGCEYNHDIPGVTPSRAVSTSAPTANVSSNLAVSTSWTATASHAITTTTLSPGTAGKSHIAKPLITSGSLFSVQILVKQSIVREEWKL
jgi:hypothetical protein